MQKRFVLTALVVLLAGAVVAMAGQEGTWTGIISDSHCGYKAGHSAACVKKCVGEHDAKYVLVNPGDKKVFTLEPQDKAAPLANENVKVTGTIEGDTIQVKTIEKVAEKK